MIPNKRYTLKHIVIIDARTPEEVNVLSKSVSLSQESKHEQVFCTCLPNVLNIWSEITLLCSKLQFIFDCNV